MQQVGKERAKTRRENSRYEEMEACLLPLFCRSKKIYAHFNFTLQAPL